MDYKFKDSLKKEEKENKGVLLSSAFPFKGYKINIRKEKRKGKNKGKGKIREDLLKEIVIG